MSFIYISIYSIRQIFQSVHPFYTVSPMASNYLHSLCTPHPPDLHIPSVCRPISGKGTYVKTVSDACAGTSNHVRYLEHIQAKVSVHFQRRGDLQIHLMSPNGTRSTLLPQRKHDYSTFGFQEWPFMSVFYWGESPIGTWKLEFENVGNQENKGREGV